MSSDAGRLIIYHVFLHDAVVQGSILLVACGWAPPVREVVHIFRCSLHPPCQEMVHPCSLRAALLQVVLPSLGAVQAARHRDSPFGHTLQVELQASVLGGSSGIPTSMDGVDSS